MPVDFSVPDDVKEAFNEAFEGRNKSAVIADLMREAVERIRSGERSREATGRILERRHGRPVWSSEELRAARLDGRS